jgi:hypothetical protein
MLRHIEGPLLQDTGEHLDSKTAEFLARVIDGGEGRSSELPDGNSIKPYHSELVRNG